jgi:hypothetical protein
VPGVPRTIKNAGTKNKNAPNTGRTRAASIRRRRR